MNISVIHYAATKTDAHTLWKNLKDLYERKTVQNKVFAIRKLVNLKYKDRRSVTEHLSNFQILVNQLNTIKVVLVNELQALLLLSSLPNS